MYLVTLILIKNYHLVKNTVFPVVKYGYESWTKKSWALKNWCFWTVILEKTLESPLDCKELKPVNPKGNKTRMFIEKTDAEAEAPILWPLYGKNWLIINRCWVRLKTGEGDNRGWDVWMPSLTRLTWVWGSSGNLQGQGSLECCIPRDHKESNTTERVN